MAADWFCEIDGKQHGPLTAAQLKELVVQRRLQSSDPVWKEGMQKKVQARTVKGLFDIPTAEAVLVSGAPKRGAPAPKQEEELIEFEMIEAEEAQSNHLGGRSAPAMPTSTSSINRSASRMTRPSCARAPSRPSPGDRPLSVGSLSDRSR